MLLLYTCIVCVALATGGLAQTAILPEEFCDTDQFRNSNHFNFFTAH